MIRYQQLDRGDCDSRLIKDFKFKPYFYLRSVPEDVQNGHLSEQLKASDKDGFALKVLRDDQIKGVFCFRKLDWDTNHFGAKVGRLDYLIYDDPAILDCILNKVDEIAKEEDIDCVYYKSNLEESELNSRLERHGYMITDVVLRQANFLNQNDILHKARSEFKVRDFKRGDEKRILDIVQKPIWMGRFHSDDRFDKRKADGVYSEWVKNIISSSGDKYRIKVIEADGKISGFAAFKGSSSLGAGRRLCVLDIIAVDPECQARGIGEYLLRVSLEEVKKEYEVVVLGTQARNYSSLNLYRKLNFKIVNCELWFHKWFKT